MDTPEYAAPPSSGLVAVARAVLDDLGVDEVKLVAIAKRPDRDAGREFFFTDGRAPFQLPPRDPVLYFLQRLRDEAHRFAIITHRAERSKALVTSELDEVPGGGPGPQAGAVEPFRLGAAGEAGGTDRQARRLYTTRGLGTTVWVASRHRNRQ